MVRPKFSSLLLRLAPAVACILLAGSPAVPAQTPTPEQIEIFQTLPPDQQQAILETLNRDGATG